jgi:tetratricopeptide (TPR) repeat protein
MTEDRTSGLQIGDAFAQIHQLLAVGQNRRACELATALVAQDPENGFALLVLSQVLVSIGDLEAAARFADQAVEREPEDDQCHFQRAIVLRRLGRFADSEKAVLVAIGLDPDFGPYHLFYAALLENCGRSRQAFVAVGRSLELDPDSSAAHQLFAKLVLEVRPRDFGISEEAARRSVELDPEDADAHAIYGLVKLQRGLVAEAEECFQAALELDANNSLALAGLAETVMGQSWLYKPFLSYSLFMMRSGMAFQLVFVAGVWVIGSSIMAALSGRKNMAPLCDLVYYGNLAFCAYTWFARPITRWILSRQYPWLARAAHV